MIIGIRQQLAKHSIDHLPLGNSIITPTISAKIDLRLFLEAQINKICRSSFFYLHNIRRIRKFFSSEASATLVHAFITCRLDYCNSLILLPPCISNIKTAENPERRRQNYLSNLSLHKHRTMSYRSSLATCKCSLLHLKRFTD